MTESQHKTQTQVTNCDDEIDLLEIVKVIWQGKWIIIATTFLFAVGSVFYALNQPNIYRSEALLAPAESSGGMSVPGQLGGLAALAGVNLGSGGKGNEVSLALEIAKSRDFLGRFIEKYQLKAPIMAAKRWDLSTNQLVFDASLYDVETDTWQRQVKPPLQNEPSIQEIHEKFKKQFYIIEDSLSGMVKISIEHYSPYLAAEWVRLLVHDLNEEMRARETKEAEDSITYLQEQLEKTSLADAHNMLYSLIEEQTKTLMLANVRPEYVLKTIDPAIVPEKRVKPKRALIAIAGTLLGGVLALIIVLVAHAIRSRKSELFELDNK